MYRIVITKVELVEKEKQEWVLIGKKDDAKYGYAPPIKIEQETELEVYIQTIEELDLQRVIMAINGIDNG